MVNTSAFVKSSEFYSTYTTTVDTSFYNIIPSNVAYVNTSTEHYIDFLLPHYRYDVDYTTEMKPYIDRGDFTVNDFALIIIPTTDEKFGNPSSFNIGHLIVELWMINKTHGILSDPKFFMKRTLFDFVGSVNVEIYVPWCDTLMDVFGATWQSMLTSSMVNYLFE